MTHRSSSPHTMSQPQGRQAVIGRDQHQAGDARLSNQNQVSWGDGSVLITVSRRLPPSQHRDQLDWILEVLGHTLSLPVRAPP